MADCASAETHKGNSQAHHCRRRKLHCIPAAAFIPVVASECRACPVIPIFLLIEASNQVVAEQVCWDSAKVQLNSGILERRYQNWDRALMHFEHARAVEPGYCEPDYWIGITLLAQQANTSRALLVRTLLTADACIKSNPGCSTQQMSQC